VTVTEGRVVDGRVVVGAFEIWKFSADHERQRPYGDLRQVSRESETYHQRHDDDIEPEADTRVGESSLTANEIDRRAQDQRVNEDRAEDGACADRQWDQERDSLSLCRNRG